MKIKRHFIVEIYDSLGTMVKSWRFESYIRFRDFVETSTEWFNMDFKMYTQTFRMEEE